MKQSAQIQCGFCANYLFFVPIANDVYAMCRGYNEGFEDIDMGAGASPAIKKYGLMGAPCEKFTAGRSLCQPLSEEPFSLHSFRQTGEKWLLKKRLKVTH